MYVWREIRVDAPQNDHSQLGSKQVHKIVSLCTYLIRSVYISGTAVNTTLETLCNPIASSAGICADVNHFRIWR